MSTSLLIILIFLLGAACGFVFGYAMRRIPRYGTLKIDCRGEKDNILFELERPVDDLYSADRVMFDVIRITSGKKISQ